MMSHALIAKWFRGDLLAKEAEHLFEVQRHDPTVRAEFERCLTIETLLSGHGHGPSDLPHFELERIEDFVISKTLEQRQGTSKKAIVSNLFPTWGLPRALVIFLPVLLVAILLPVLWLLRSPGERPSDTGTISKSLFAPRGVETPYETHLFLFCVEDRREETAVRRLDRPASMREGMDSCAVNGELQFAFTNLSEVYTYLYIFGIDEQARRLWYFPKPAHDESRAISRAREMLLGDSILVHVNHRPGRVRVFAVFSKTPVTDGEIDEAMKGIRHDPEVLILPLERPDIYVESFSMHISSQGDAP